VGQETKDVVSVGEGDLYDIVRQLRAELEWAARTGIEPVAFEAPKAPAQPTIISGPPAPAISSLPSVPPPSAPERPAAPGPRIYPELVQLGERPKLGDIREVIGDCTRCKLSRLGRTQVVFGVGNPSAELMFVGEGPGADEDRQGEPFVGKAGQLLTKIIEAGMGLKRSDVYIANVVKCRPPNNRDPEPDEVEACESFLRAQIASIGPKVIVTLGRHASLTLLRTTTPITRLRGRWSAYAGIPVMPTYHPAYLLRNPAEKRFVWEDIQEVLRKLGRPIPKRGEGA
jgi:uracil-DNA glycosylase